MATVLLGRVFEKKGGGCSFSSYPVERGVDENNKASMYFLVCL